MSSPKPSRGIELVSSAVGEVGAVSTTTPELAQSSKKAVKRLRWWSSSVVVLQQLLKPASQNGSESGQP